MKCCIFPKLGGYLGEKCTAFTKKKKKSHNLSLLYVVFYFNLVSNNEQDDSFKIMAKYIIIMRSCLIITIK